MSINKLGALAGVVAVTALAAVAGYKYIRSGGLIARQTPSSVEAATAQWLLNLSVPASAKQLKNPVEATDASLTAGRALYAQKCEVCHGYDGGGKTETGSGLYPPPLDLRGMEVKSRTDGELFYFIQNGIRNTAMPGWRMPDQNLWQLVLFVRNLPQVASTTVQAVNRATATFVGSGACKSCHAAVYERWSKTLMANVIRDPKAHPDAIIPDLSKPNPLVTFTKDDIAFVYGSKWKQRYFKKAGDDYYPLPAQWDITNKVWKPYHPAKGTDWWTEFYPDANSERPTGPLCDGCHAVNYNIETKKVTEWNVGCEKCHGAGSEHVKSPLASNTLNPARMDYVAGNDVCIQCHSQGQPLTNPIQGKYYDWPVGFNVGLKLNDFWKLEERDPGETTFTHYADGTAHKNRMQGNDYVTSLMYTHGVTCFSCHDAHGTGNEAILRKPPNEICLDCHGPNSPNGPRSATMEQHTHHKADSPGSECIACHMPKIQQTLPGVNVRSHTFRFVYPATTDTLKTPNACNICHADKSTSWATAAVKSWTDRSPWRAQ